MPLRTALWVLLAISVAFVLAPRSAVYDTTLPPPTGRETYAEVLPVSIGGVERSFEPLADASVGLQGTRVRYGELARIDIARLTSQPALDRYVADQVRPRLAAYPRHGGDRDDGAWRLHGHGANGRLLAWQNQHWLFVIEADSQAVFDDVVDQFAYVRRR